MDSVRSQVEATSAMRELQRAGKGMPQLSDSLSHHSFYGEYLLLYFPFLSR